MNPNKPGTFEKKGQQMGQSIDKKIDQGKQKIKQTKESVSKGFEHTKTYLKSLKIKTENKINRGIQITKNTYNSLSNSVKDQINTGREQTKQTINQITNSLDHTIMTLEQYKEQLSNDVKKGLVKSIQFADKAGELIVDYGNKKINILIGNVKHDFNRIKNTIERGTINAIQITKDGVQFLNKSRQAVIKYSTAIAVATGLLVYKGGKLTVAKTIEASLKLGQQVQEINDIISSTAKEKTLRAIQLVNQGKDIAIQYGNKVKVISVNAALKAGVIITKNTSYVLNKANKGVQYLNQHFEENLQASKKGVKLGRQRVAQTN